MVLSGKGAAPGAAVGSIFIYNEKYNIPAEAFLKEGQEQSHLDKYLSVKSLALEELEKIRLSMQKIDPSKADIFIAHKEIVEDIIINEEIPAKILNDRWAGDWAIYQVYETVLAVLKQTSDPLISERAVDFDDVRALLLKFWYGQNESALASLKEPVIIASRQLKPSDTAGLNKDKVLAILTEEGGITSHTAIIAKSYGIPAVLGIEGLLGFVSQGQLAAVNATEGTVILDPEEAQTGEYRKITCDYQRDKTKTEAFRKGEAYTSCGQKIEIGVNISGANNDELHAEGYTDSVGLFRTEFLYIGRNTLPTEEEQFAVYRKVLETFGKKCVVLRTLDIGGDKQLPGLEYKPEENPFLGNRALRFCFSNPDVFITQIKAALRASIYGNLWLMFPMAGSLDDIRTAKDFAAQAKDELQSEGKEFAEIKTGVMIETPSIAMISDLVVEEVDFASIGSNDLCQYMCAADRINSAVESYYQSYHPAMLRIIKKIAEPFNNAEKPISICGELGGDPLASPLLIGLGLRKLSMGAASVAGVKRAVASVSVAESQEIAEKALQFSTAAEVERFLRFSPVIL